jgi:hypothetical protein
MKEDKKPYRGFGMQPNHTDANGNVVKVTKNQCMSLLKKYMAKQTPKNCGCKKLAIVDCGDYFKWSAC